MSSGKRQSSALHKTWKHVLVCTYPKHETQRTLLDASDNLETLTLKETCTLTGTMSPM